MFKSICISRQNVLTGNPLDLGLLAECLVFYQEVCVIADVDTFKFLVRTCTHSVLSELLEMGSLKIQFFDNITGVRTLDTGLPAERHDFVTIGAKRLKYPKVARDLFEELVGPSGKGLSKLERRFSRFVSRSEYTRSTLGTALADVGDDAYISSAVRSLLAYVAPEYMSPDPLLFRPTVGIDSIIRVRTNIDFKAANDSYHMHVPVQHSSLSVALILSHVLDTRRDIEVASQRSSDIALAPIRSAMAACKFAEVWSHGARNLRALDLFQERVISDARSIREAVNSGQRNFADVLKLVRQGQKFKEWLRKGGGSDELHDAYCREVSRLDWADKLPSKALRWLMMSGAGLGIDAVAGTHIGAAGGLALSAADALLFDKLIRGWRPSQFVEGPLREFLRPSG